MSTIFKIPDGLKEKRRCAKEFIYDRDLEYSYFNSILFQKDQYDDKMNLNIAFHELQLNLPISDLTDSDIVVIEFQDLKLYKRGFLEDFQSLLKPSMLKMIKEKL